MNTAFQRKLLNEREAAEYLGYRPATFRQSRYLGVLAGAAPPKHVKLGRAVRYDIADLNAWVENIAKLGTAK